MQKSKKHCLPACLPAVDGGQLVGAAGRPLQRARIAGADKPTSSAVASANTGGRGGVGAGSGSGSDTEGSEEDEDGAEVEGGRRSGPPAVGRGGGVVGGEGPWEQEVHAEPSSDEARKAAKLARGILPSALVDDQDFIGVTK